VKRPHEPWCPQQAWQATALFARLLSLAGVTVPCSLASTHAHHHASHAAFNLGCAPDIPLCSLPALLFLAHCFARLSVRMLPAMLDTVAPM
jgi:hypothetical protein